METPKRKEYLKFTTPYLKIPMVIATNEKVAFINNIEDIKHKNVGITEGYAFVELLKAKYKNLNIIEVKNIDDGLIKVNRGELFGFIGTLASISHQFQSGLQGELKIAGKVDVNWELGIAVRNDDQILFNIFEKVITNFDRKKHQQILNNWISIKYEKGVDYKLLTQIFSVVFVLLLFIAYRQYILKKSNNELQIAVNNKTKDLQKLNDNLAVKIEAEVEKNLLIQEQLFKSEKLASMGEMIGNIAHQWRQPLSVISTASSSLIMQQECNILDDKNLIKYCNTINDNTQYLSKTIDDFRNFIKGERIKNVFHLSTTINSFLNLVEGSIKNNNIKIITNLQENISIDAYENELIQCLINIFNNAQDALNETIAIKDDKIIFISSSKIENNIQIKIKDTAGGIPQNVLSKIFEPYFTTKHASQGTGLGLHMTYSLIVDGMKGSILASNVNYDYKDKNYTGAEFTISLPIS